VAKRIHAEIPELQAGYESWWKTTGPDLTSAYATATEKSFWPLASAHLVAAAPFMLATHDRNLDDDCQGIPVLKPAAKTTDAAESQFATYDYAMGLGAGFGATAGVAQNDSHARHRDAGRHAGQGQGRAQGQAQV